MISKFGLGRTNGLERCVGLCVSMRMHMREGIKHDTQILKA